MLAALGHDGGLSTRTEDREDSVQKARLIFFVVAVALWPATAHAGFWSWLEELSGPGPFRGYMFSFTVACVRDDGFNACPVGDEATRQRIVVRVGRFTSKEDRARFKDLPANDEDNQEDVHVMPVSGLWMFRLHRSLEAGPGIGFMRVSGKGFDAFSKVSLTPLSATFTPFALSEELAKSRWAYVVRLELDTSYFPQGFNGADFENTRTNFDSGPEFLTRAGFVLDLGALVSATRSSLRR
jgi:hypothetical protein